MNDANQLQDLLSNFTGSECLFKHPLSSMVYTEGVQEFATHAGGGAYWLLDILMTEPAIREGMRNLGIVFITLDAKDGKANLTVREDTDIAPLFERAIDFTDCPDGQWRFYLNDGVLMLPSEY